MIKLERPLKPEKLTEKKEKVLIKRFKINRKANVWYYPYIKEPLELMAHNKCSYCEMKLNEESKYITIDHFHHKSLYPNEVASWENLLPSCSRCNSNKGVHDTKVAPIINPTIMDPKEYLYVKGARYRAKNEIGKRTISLLDLNNSTKLVAVRYFCITEIENKLESLYYKMKGLDSNKANADEIYIVRNGVKNLLYLAQPNKEYSAIIASALINDRYYVEIRKLLYKKKLWNNEFQELHNIGEMIKLDIEMDMND